MPNIPSPHGDKLNALLENKKLPAVDKANVQEAIERYNLWRSSILQASGSEENRIKTCIKALNSYMNFIEYDLIFKSTEDFLYRQKGQLKLDNTVMEEFLPLFVFNIFSDKIESQKLSLGPTTCISGIRFDGSISSSSSGGDIELRQKDQDFAISKKLFIKTSFESNFSEYEQKETNLAFLACECKTNLDKTMFQEASATALDLKETVPCSKYLLLCDWLDMTPISTSTTAIDEIIILRKAKRISSSERQNFSVYEMRKRYFDSYKEFLESHPYQVSSFERFINHIKEIIIENSETEILERGYF